MKFAATVIVFAIVFAITYGVLFRLAYPTIEIYQGLMSLFALAGLVTSILFALFFAGKRGAKN